MADVESKEKFAAYLSAEKYRSENKYGQAIALFEKILDKDPAEHGVRVVLADLFAKAGDPPRALENYYRAASAFAAAGQRKKAFEVLERMQRVDASGSSIFLKKVRRALGVTARAASARARSFVEDGDGIDDGVSVSLSAPLFADLSATAREDLVRGMAVMNVREGSVIFREGDPGTSLYVIAQGRVSLTFRVPVADGWDEEEARAGGERTFAELGPGEFFGEFAFLTGTSRQFTARALRDGKIFQLPKARLTELQRSHPGLARTLSTFYKERVLDRVLAGSMLFGALAADQRHAIVEKFTLEGHPCGAVIIAEGSRGDMLYLIRQGDVRISATGPGGDEVFLTNLHANDFFGEFSFLTGRPRSASVIATSDVELLVVSKGSLEPLLGQHPEVLQVMRKAYFERMADNLHKLASSG